MVAWTCFGHVDGGSCGHSASASSSMLAGEPARRMSADRTVRSLGLSRPSSASRGPSTRIPTPAVSDRADRLSTTASRTYTGCIPRARRGYTAGRDHRGMNTTQKTQKCLAVVASLGLGISLILGSAGCAGSPPPARAAAEDSNPTPDADRQYGGAAHPGRARRPDPRRIRIDAPPEPHDRLRLRAHRADSGSAHRLDAGTPRTSSSASTPNVKSVVAIEEIRDEFGLQTETEQFQRPDGRYRGADRDLRGARADDGRRRVRARTRRLRGAR